tara:strand:- start:924 stop:1304 length:381 start_codon:yes stop_codon:yes gene_type:complete
MKLNAFEKIIRKVVREEIDYALRREIALLKEELALKPHQRVVETKHDPFYDANPQEAKNFRAKLKEQMPPPNFSTGNGTLDSLLSETALAPTPEETFAANDPVNQFINKDYSPLMEAIDKKKDFRP